MYKIYAQVVLNNNSKSTDRIYSYGIEPKFEEKIKPGKRVKVKFGNNKKMLDAIVVSLSETCEVPESRVKPITDIIDDDIIISEEMIKLAFWIRERYVCKFSDVIRLMVPAMMKFEHNIIIKVINSSWADIQLDKKETELLSILGTGNIEFDKLKKVYTGSDLNSLIERLKEKKIIEVLNKESENKNKYYEKIINLTENDINIESGNIKITPKQQKIIDYLRENNKTNMKIVMKETDVSSSIINTLIKKEIITCQQVLYESDEKDNITYDLVDLNHEQRLAFEKITSSDSKAFLLHGVTGSGKTEVYMSVIEYYQKQGKQSIMLVPEISLTSQTIERFKKRFGNRIAIFHSKLSKKERFIQWNKVYNKEADVIVGARSAIFAPIKDIGVIIVDEEHEDSYKSSVSPKYDTVETAIKLSYISNSKVVLGTATPSLRTYNLVMKGNIQLIEMRSRAKSATMPNIAVVDMCKELEKGNNTFISEPLYNSMKQSLNKKEQVILFINKRGYAGFISCKKCGHVVKCDKCDVSMTYHMKGNNLRCHYCGRSRPMVTTCSKCGSEKIEQFGAGTQHVEQLVKHLFPMAITERMDLDSMSKKDSYENIYNSFKNRQIDILIGTQMLAKGFDFPEVTTVGVLSADAILNLPFYSASERTFQLLTQVSGRAGRDIKSGRVFIQTYEPENFIIKASSQNDYDSFVKEELSLRKEFAFPPFVNIINICIISRDEELANKIATDKYNELSQAIKDMIKERSILLYKPIPHNIYKINDEYRVNLFIKTSNHSMNKLREIIRSIYMEQDIENIKISININTDTV